MLFFDPFYLIFVMLPGLALSAWASYRTKSAFNKYSKFRDDGTHRRTGSQGHA